MTEPTKGMIAAQENTGKRVYYLILVSFCFFVLMLLIQVAFADDADLPRKVKRLGNQNARERAAAVEEIARSGRSGQAAKALADRLAVEKDPGVRHAIYENIGGIGDKETAAVLRGTIKTETDKGARQMAILSLGKTQDDASVAPLRSIFLTETEEMNARLQAANALSYIPVEAAVRALEEGLKDKNPAIRLQAACSLAAFAGPVLADERVRIIRKQAQQDADAKNRQYIKENIVKKKFRMNE